MALETARDPVSEHELMPPPDISHVVTEDDTPVDNVFAEKQERLLTEPLYSSWTGPESGKFWATANVGLFSKMNEPAVVPDVLLSLDVSPGDYVRQKERRSYFMFAYGKPPDVVIEVVSNKEGNELGSKLKTYARIAIPYYVIYDPELLVIEQPLRVMVIRGKKYVDLGAAALDEIGLGLTIWEGQFESMRDHWLRWTNANGILIPTGFERAEQERQRADQERQRADRLAAKLRELGKDPGE